MGYFPPNHPWEFIAYYVIFAIPLGILGFYLAFKDGFIGTKTRRQRIMLDVFVVIGIWYVGLHSYLHFVLPYKGVH